MLYRVAHATPEKNVTNKLLSPIRQAKDHPTHTQMNVDIMKPITPRAMSIRMRKKPHSDLLILLFVVFMFTVFEFKSTATRAYLIASDFRMFPFHSPPITLDHFGILLLRIDQL